MLRLEFKRKTSELKVLCCVEKYFVNAQQYSTIFGNALQVLRFQTIPKCEKLQMLVLPTKLAPQKPKVLYCVSTFPSWDLPMLCLTCQDGAKVAFRGSEKRRRWLPKWPKCERCNDFLDSDTKVMSCARKVTLAEADLKPGSAPARIGFGSARCGFGSDRLGSGRLRLGSARLGPGRPRLGPGPARPKPNPDFTSVTVGAGH